MPALVRAGLAEDAGADVTVLTPMACSGTAPDVALALVVRAAREGDCSLSRKDAAVVLDVLGHEERDADATFGLLEEAGEGWIEGDRLHLSRGLCRGLPGAPAMTARREAEVGAWVEDRLLRAEGCSLSRSDLAVEAVAVGIGPGDIDRAVAMLDARSRLAASGEVPRLQACP